MLFRNIWRCPLTTFWEEAAVDFEDTIIKFTNRNQIIFWWNQGEESFGNLFDSIL